MNGVGKRLLYIDMFFHSHGHYSCWRMGVIWRSNDYSVDIFLLIQHDAKVFVLLGLLVGCL